MKRYIQLETPAKVAQRIMDDVPCPFKIKSTSYSETSKIHTTIFESYTAVDDEDVHNTIKDVIAWLDAESLPFTTIEEI